MSRLLTLLALAAATLSASGRIAPAVAPCPTCAGSYDGFRSVMDSPVAVGGLGSSVCAWVRPAIQTGDHVIFSIGSRTHGDYIAIVQRFGTSFRVEASKGTVNSTPNITSVFAANETARVCGIFTSGTAATACAKGECVSTSFSVSDLQLTNTTVGGVLNAGTRMRHFHGDILEVGWFDSTITDQNAIDYHDGASTLEALGATAVYRSNSGKPVTGSFRLSPWQVGTVAGGWSPPEPPPGTAPTITSDCPLPGATEGSSYEHQLTAAGDEPIAWDLSAGALPTGVSLSSGGLVSGTPTVNGEFNFTLRATNSAGDDTKACSLTVAEEPVSGQGSIEITRLSGNAPASAQQDAGPWTNVWVDSQTSTDDQGAMFTTLASGSHTVRWDDLGVFHAPNGVTEAAVCYYEEEGTPCTNWTFNLTPECSLPESMAGVGECSVPVTVQSGDVARVALRFTIVPEGFAAGTTGGVAGTPVAVTSLSCSNATAGSFGNALVNCEEGGCFIYADRSLGDNPNLTGCAGSQDADRGFIISGTGNTIWGHTTKGGFRITGTDITINPLARGTSFATGNMIVTGITLDTDSASACNAEFNIENGSGSVNPGVGPIDGVAFVGNLIYGTGPQNCETFGVARRGIQNITVSGNIIGDNRGGTGIINQLEAIKISAHSNFIPEVAVRAPMGTWRVDDECSGFHCTQSPDINWHWVNNVVGMFWVVPGNDLTPTTQSSFSRGAKGEVRNNFYLGLSTLGGDRRVLNKNLINCGNRIVLDEENGCFSDDAMVHYSGHNPIVSYTNNPLFRVLTKDYTNNASFEPPVISTDEPSYNMFRRVVSRAGPSRPLPAKIVGFIEDLETEFAKFVPEVRFDDDGTTGFTKWATQGGMVLIDGVFIKDSDTVSIPWTAESDAELYCTFDFRKTANPATTKTIACMVDGATAKGCLKVNSSGAVLLDTDAAAGGEETVRASLANDTWHRIMFVRKASQTATSCPGVLNAAPGCSTLQAGVKVAGETSGTAMSMRPGFAPGNDVAAVTSLEFREANGTGEFHFDDIQCSPTFWPSEGGFPVQ